MSNIRKPVLGYTVIITIVIGLLVLSYKVLFPKQYTEIEFGMSQEDLIELKGKPDEVVDSEDKTFLIFRYNSDEHLEYQCESYFTFSKSFWDESKYDKLKAFGYKYSKTNTTLEDDKKIFSELRDKLVKIYGRKTFMDNYDKFNEAYNNGEIILTWWENKNGEVDLSCDKERGIRVAYSK